MNDAVATNGRPRYVLRPMRLEDIPQVVQVDILSFSSPWSPGSYAFEINNGQNTGSRMIVLEAQAPLAQGWRRFWQRLGGHSGTPLIIGYAGMWNISGEAHISTIAVHPDWRGRGLGETLLNGLLNMALAAEAEYAILEVRVGNESAQALYRKYGFEVAGRRKNYYRDNNEDAFLMNLARLDPDRLQALTDALRVKIDFVNQSATQLSPPSRLSLR